ncbi:hypothetical protein [Vulcanisaeta sp. JCM 16161]|uniref:hypothetical protein n=1 Tax=Vulcanisaeta sp. JCM 16161 TaxID=1295372 RepID=UPI0006D221F6|nr:hypothetical protein [Vulcanisaeta sp. JCM 16161]
MSEDLEHWVKVVDNKAVDEYSRHFHFIGYDPYRDWLVATLGDANPIRVVYSPDLGRTWRRLYVGPWQFVPFIALGDRLVFGMDSGVARGGVGVYYPNSDRWSFRFLRFVHGRASVVQFSSLIKVNDLWVAALGSPQVFVASRDLNNWFLLYAEGYSTDYNHHMGVIPAGDSVIGFTGESIVLFNVDELGNYFNPPPAVITYLGITDRVKGLGFRVKRLFRR